MHDSTDPQLMTLRQQQLQEKLSTVLLKRLTELNELKKAEGNNETDGVSFVYKIWENGIGVQNID